MSGVNEHAVLRLRAPNIAGNNVRNLLFHSTFFDIPRNSIMSFDGFAIKDLYCCALNCI